jgi:hypothetical protein
MADQIYINSNDETRILFTEVLPYELPIVFSNERLYYYFKQSKNEAPPFINKLLLDERDYSIPFEYSIRQGINKNRSLFLIHPAFQMKFVDLYKNYNQLILSLCNKSTFSLRHPSKIAAFFYDKSYVNEDEDSLKTSAVDQEPDPFGKETKYSSSYFYYARYNQLYRFIDSPEFIELESKFTHLIKFDIAKCFASIYTPTIAWAVKGKAFAKRNNNNFAFETMFDELMAKVNYQETNGIVIGPEFSRIFSEIIFQQIDLNVLDKIKKENIQGHEYSVKRFVDDYFVFTRNATLATKIFGIIEESLKEYKLHLNDAKTEHISLPFITPQTVAKTDVTQLLKASVLSWLNHLKKRALNIEHKLEDEDSQKLKTPYKFALDLIKNLKIAVKRSNESFSVVSGPSLSYITRSLYGLHKAMEAKGFNDDDLIVLQNVLLICVEVVFFFYPMDFRVRTTYLVAQFIIIASRVSERFGPLHGYIVSNIKNHIERIVLQLSYEKPGVEILNLLLALKEIYPEDKLDKSVLLRIINPKFTGEELNDTFFEKNNYFELMSFLYYIRDEPAYSEIKTALIKNVIKRLSIADLIRDSEMIHLFFDCLSCPWIQNSEKNEIIRVCYELVYKTPPAFSEIEEVRKFANSKLGFTDWNMKIGIEKMLRKKQLNPVY